MALGKSLAEVRGLSQEEIRTWRMFDSIWPIGDLRDDIRACMVANAIRGGLGAPGVALKKFTTKLPTPSERRQRAKRNIGEELAAAMGLRLHKRGEEHLQHG